METRTDTATKTEMATSADGTQIAFSRSGEGPTIVMVDGAMSHRAINPSAAQLADLLGSKFTIVTYDRRGRGGSSDVQPYAVEREVEDLAAVIEATGGQAFVLGASSGAVLALHAAAAGLPITKLALYEPPFIVDDARPALPEDYVPQLRARAASKDPGSAVEYFMTVAMSMPPDQVKAMRGQPFFAPLEGVAYTIAYDGQVMGDMMDGRPEPLLRWNSVETSTLIMDGSDSEDWMHHGVDALAKVLPNAERRTLFGQTHQFETSVLAPELDSFFSDA
jgi:pimeloyl-ACP methyl ester carboxylesterase